MDRQQIRVDTRCRFLLEKRDERLSQTEIVVDTVAGASREPTAKSSSTASQPNPRTFAVIQVQHVRNELENLRFRIGIRCSDVADDKILYQINVGIAGVGVALLELALQRLIRVLI